MTFRLVSLFVFALAVLQPGLRATTVVPPSFPELVGEADAIYRGRVTAVEARRLARPDGGTVIKTFVTFAIDRVLKGAAQKEIVLEFLGGTVGGDTLAVSGMPTFAVGAQEIVFVQKNGVQFCPLVAVMHGRYRVMRDEAAGREFVARDNGMPLTDASEVKMPMSQLPVQLRAAAAASATPRALSTTAFETSIASEVQRPTLRARPN
ncbi:MAG: hypothetical protein EXS37_14265 [Opitutus sp.]|nr:hypothetical protein [Opitutus sp.]